MLPVIAIVGRPNVGKSTLFNRLTKSRDALVADFEGLTRDRKYGQGLVGEYNYIVVDTGGVSGGEEGIDAPMAQQSFLAVEEADIVLFMVDGKSGLMPADEFIAHHLRQVKKPVYIVVNKTDGQQLEVAVSEFYGLGIGNNQPLGIAASQNRGITQLIEEIFSDYLSTFKGDQIPDIEKREHTDRVDYDRNRIAIIGRPNVGKSTLVNRLLGEDRVVVFDQAGTTRDSIFIPYDREDKKYMLIDTAGVRRRKSVSETVEKFSIVKTLQAIENCNVVVLVLDAREGVYDQDISMLGFALDCGRAVVIAINKWDGLTAEQKENIRSDIKRKLDFMHFADMHFISALHGTGVGHLYESVDVAYESAFAKWSTSKLTNILLDATKDHQPPLVNGRRIKPRMAHQGGSNPPRIIVHGNQMSKLPGSYKRYLENVYRKILNIRGTPIQFEFKQGDNPFAEQGRKIH